MNEDIKFLIEKKIEILQSVGQVTMLWWVSVIVLCLSVFGAAWLHRDTIYSRRHVIVGGIVILLLLLFFAAYGVTVVRYLVRVQDELHVLLAKANVPVTSFDSEIEFFRIAMWTAGGDFAAIIFGWIFLCASIWKQAPEAKRRKSSNSNKD